MAKAAQTSEAAHFVASPSIVHPFAYSPAMDAQLFQLNRDLIVALAGERQRIEALPVELALDAEWAAIEEICTPSVAIMEKIRAVTPHTICGWQAKAQAEAIW